MAGILSVKNLYYSYDDELIFNNLSFFIEKNTINGIIGPNKCGKTTLIRILCGILRSQDNVCVDNIPLTKENLREYSLKIGSVFFKDSNKFLCEDVVNELIFSLENLCFSKSEINIRLKEILDIFDINDIKKKKIKELSKFEQVKVALASSLIHRPKVLLVDDIFDEISYQEYCEIISIIRKFIENYEMSVLFTTNNLEKILLCDKVMFINDKKIELEGNVNQILEHDNILAREGMNIPLMIDLSLKLKFYNLVDDVIMDVSGMVEELWK
ncbi:MAG: ATP-binding cassette domain-containing protein [Bacilli bacterium]